MGVDMEEISQTERYQAGHYRTPVLTAVRQRDDDRGGAGPVPHQGPSPTRVRRPGRPRTRPTGSGDLARFPYKPYCRDCGRDTVTLTAYDEETTDLAYTCDITGYEGVTNLTTDFEGKLVWKVDWPMRWAFEHVDFEPAGMDHATPGSSFTVGHELVESIYGMPRTGVVRLRVRRVRRVSRRCPRPPAAHRRPRTRSRSSRHRSCAGSTCAGTPSRRSTSTSEPRWCACTTSGTRSVARRPTRRSATRRCSPTSAPCRPPPQASCPPRRSTVPFRLLSSVADVTAGSAELISATVVRAGHPHDSRRGPPAAPGQGDDLDRRVRRPRRPDHRPRRRPTPSALAALERRASVSWLAQLLDRLPDDLELEPTDRRSIYGVPKLARGLGDRRPADRRGQGRPEGVLRAALQPAGRRRARTAAADPVPGARGATGSARCSRSPEVRHRPVDSPNGP